MPDWMKSMDELMTGWADAHRAEGRRGFVADGAVDPAAYAASAPKICFFLKEAYSRDGADWSLSDWLRQGGMTRMWGNVAEWSYGIRHTSRTEIPRKPTLSAAEKTALLRSVAVVNVKKSDGRPASDYAELLAVAMRERTYLARELALLAPDVLVCGNNSSLLRLLYGAKPDGKGGVGDGGRIDLRFMRENGFALVGEQIILDFYHPANQYPALMNYYAVCSLYQQAIREREDAGRSRVGALRG